MATVTFPEIFNNGLTLLNGAISDSATSIIVDSAVALGLDNSTTDAYVTIIAPSTFGFNPFLTPETLEVIQVTAVSGNSLTVTRGVDGTTGIAFGDNAYVMTRNNAATLERVYDALTDGTDSLNIDALITAGNIDSLGDITASDIINIASGKVKLDATRFDTTSQISSNQPTMHLSTIDATNSTTIHITPAYLGGGSNTAQIDFFRNTNTSGAVRTRWFKGDNSSIAMVDINAKTGEFKTLGSVTSPAQTATGDGTTDIDWRTGNNFNFTFGAFNETFSFTDPDSAGRLTLKLLQDSVGSRTATYPANVNWAANTAPTLTTTANTGTDIIEFYFDGSEYHGSVMTADSRNA